MGAELAKRLKALEAQQQASCVHCEMAQLNGAPVARCSHSRHFSLVDELTGLNKLEGAKT